LELLLQVYIRGIKVWILFAAQIADVSLIIKPKKANKTLE
jgi:hypothetical protein